MSNIVFKSTIQFLKFVNEKIAEKEKLYGSKKRLFEKYYNEQRMILLPITVNKYESNI